MAKKAAKKETTKNAKPGVGLGGKRIRNARVGVDPNKHIQLGEAVKMLKERTTKFKTKFDETVDVALNLDVDPKQSDQQIRGVVSMPHGVGKELRVAVFAKGDKAKEAKEAGADIVGDEDLAAKIEKGQIDFDRCVATPDMMVLVGKIGKILGPKGLMPNPKLGTVTTDVAKAVKSAKSGQVEYRLDKAGIVHAGVAKASFTEQQITENIRTFLGAIKQAKPQSVKGNFFKKAAISSTMGPGIRLNVADLWANEAGK